MPRHKNINWNNSGHVSGGFIRGMTEHEMTREVLMDIRDELQALNAVIACPNARDIPNILRRIDMNTKKRKRKAVTK